jgi:small subunit ribosomal protein S20
MAKRTASAKKQARAGVRRSARNRATRSEVKTRIVKARRSFAASPTAESERAALAIDAIRALDRAAAKGILHRNNAARRKARLMRQLVKVGGVKAATPTRKGAAAKAAPAPAAPARKGKK